MALSKGTYNRKMKRIARMKDQDRAARWRTRVEKDFGSDGRGVQAKGASLVQDALSSIGRVVSGVGSALLGRTAQAPA